MSTYVKPLHNIRSLQLIQTKHSRGRPCKSDHEVLREDSKVTVGRSVRRDSSIGGVEVHNLDCSKPQGNILNHAHLRVTCILPCKGPETRADTATSGGQNGCRRWENWSDEKEQIWHKGRSQQLGA